MPVSSRSTILNRKKCCEGWNKSRRKRAPGNQIEDHIGKSRCHVKSINGFFCPKRIGDKDLPYQADEVAENKSKHDSPRGACDLTVCSFGCAQDRACVSSGHREDYNREIFLPRAPRRLSEAILFPKRPSGRFFLLRNNMKPYCRFLLFLSVISFVLAACGNSLPIPSTETTGSDRKSVV